MYDIINVAWPPRSVIPCWMYNTTHWSIMLILFPIVQAAPLPLIGHSSRNNCIRCIIMSGCVSLQTYVQASILLLLWKWLINNEKGDLLHADYRGEMFRGPGPASWVCTNHNEANTECGSSSNNKMEWTQMKNWSEKLFWVRLWKESEFPASR